MARPARRDRAWLLVIAWLARCASANGHIRVHANRTDLEVASDTCEALTECFCIQDTVCGWCESSGLAMAMKGNCHRWVVDPSKCPRLHCSMLREKALFYWLLSLILPTFHLMLWFGVIRLQRTVDARQRRFVQNTDALSASISFATGHAKHMSLPGSFVKFQDINDVVEDAKEFFVLPRTFEAFQRGVDCYPEERLPCKASRPYNLNVGDLSKLPGEKNFEGARVPPHRLMMTLKILVMWRTALGSNLALVCGLMFVSSLYMALLSFSAQMLPQRIYWSMALFTKEAGFLVSSLQTTVSVLLSFYALGRIHWYWSMMTQGFIVQGRAHDIAMIGGAVGGNTEAEARARYALYRHIMLCFFFAYQALTPNYKFIGFGPLLNCGLLLPEEADILEKANSAPRTLTESWVSKWIHMHIQDNSARDQAFMALREFRAALAGVGDLVVQRAPVSFESLLYVAVYALVLLLPFGPSQIDYENRAAVSTGPHLAITLGHGVLIAFYVSLVHLLYHLQAPFDNIGAPHDCLNPTAIMITTERKCRDYLAGPPSPSLNPTTDSIKASGAEVRGMPDVRGMTDMRGMADGRGTPARTLFASPSTKRPA